MDRVSCMLVQSGPSSEYLKNLVAESDWELRWLVSQVVGFGRIAFKYSLARILAIHAG